MPDQGSTIRFKFSNRSADFPSDSSRGAYLKNLLDAMPPDWHHIDGWLEPHPMLMDRVASNVMLTVDQSGEIAFSRGDSSLGYDPLPVLLENKWPSRLQISDVGSSLKADAFTRALNLAAAYLLHRSFSGELRLYLNLGKDWQTYRARCKLSIQPWDYGQPKSQTKDSFIELEWQEERGGSRADVAPIVEACRAMDLTEVTMVPELAAAD